MNFVATLLSQLETDLDCAYRSPRGTSAPTACRNVRPAPTLIAPNQRRSTAAAPELTSRFDITCQRHARVERPYRRPHLHRPASRYGQADQRQVNIAFDQPLLAAIGNAQRVLS